MEREEENNNGDGFKISKLKCFLIIISSIIILTIIYYIEKTLYYLITLLVFYWPISIIIIIGIHLLTLRYIVYQILFIGQIFFVDRHNKYLAGVKQALIFEKSLSMMLRSLLTLSDNKIEKTYTKLIRIDIDIETCMENVNHFIDIFTKMKNEFNNLSNNQDIFYNYLNTLKNEMDSIKLLEKLSNEIQKKGEQPIDTVVILPNDILNIFENNFNSIYNTIKDLIDILTTFMNYEVPWYSFKAYKTFFTNDLLGSINQWQMEISKIYNLESKKLKTKDNTILDYIIINSNNIEENKKKNLIIICGPNGSPYQYYCKNIKLNIYLEKGIDVIFWNYRGYGYSTGKVTIKNIKSDIIELYEEIISWKKYGKIGIHGISVGGIPSCYLAFNKPDICLLISDRNFGQIDYIVKDYFLGEFLFYLYKFICFPNNRTIDHFINCKCYKIILNDPHDIIVREGGSLKTLVSDYFIKNFIVKKNKNSNIVKLALNDNSIIENNKNENNNLIYGENALNLLLENDFEVKDFKKCLIEIIERLDDDDLKLENNFIEKIKKNFLSIKNRNQYMNIEVNPLKTHAIDFLRNKMAYFLDKFESAGDTLDSLLDIIRNRRKELFINNFFNNFLVFGIKHSEHNIFYYSTEGRENIIKEAIENLEDIINSDDINPIKDNTIIKEIYILQNYLKKIEKNLKEIKDNINKKSLTLEERLISEESSLDNSDNSTDSQYNFNEENYYDYEKNLNLLRRGNLISLSCGHNGNLNNNELISFNYQLEKSGIFNLIDI